MIKVFKEIHLQDFDFLGSAEDAAEIIDTNKAWRNVEDYINETYPEGIDEEELNDLFAHNFETILDISGIDLADEEEQEDFDE